MKSKYIVHSESIDKQIYSTVMTFIILMFLFKVFSSYAEAIDVVVATGVNHDPPYVYGDEKISPVFPGVTIEILRLIETKSDMKFIIKKRPWKRVVDEIRANTLDGGFHFSYKEDRKSFVAYPIPQGKTVPDPKYSISNRSYTIYRLRGQKIYWNGKQVVMASKEKLVIGAIRGSSITDKINKLGHVLKEVDADLQLINLLLIQRVDAFIALENMLDPKIKKLDSKERILIEKSLPPVVNKPYYIAFSKKFYRNNPKRAWKVWETIELIRNSGELQAIYARYSDKE